MKVFKKIVSLILTAAIMMSMICVGTVSAGAATTNCPYKVYTNVNGNGDLSIFIDGVDIDKLFALGDKYFTSEHNYNYYNASISFGSLFENGYRFFISVNPDGIGRVSCSNEDFDDVNLNDVNAYFYTSKGSTLTKGFAIEIPNNSTNKSIINNTKKQKTASVFAFSASADIDKNYYVKGQEGDEYGAYWDISVKTLNKSEKISKYSSDNKNNNEKPVSDLGKPVIDIFEEKNKTYLIFRAPIDELWQVYDESSKKGKTYFNIEMSAGNYIFNFSAIKTYKFNYSITDPNGKNVSFDNYSSNLYADGWQLTFDSNSAVAKAIKSDSAIQYNYYIKTKSNDYLYGDNATHTKYIFSSEKSISSLSFSKVSDYTYTGKAHKPAVTVKDGDYTLKKGTDYTLSYKNNKDIGTASITIKGKGKYTGSKTIQFKIVPKKTTLKVTKKSDTKAKFTWAAVDGAEKYQIYYSTDGKKYNKLATVSGGKTSATISKLDFDKYDYKFKIRSYGIDDGKKYYSSFSKTVTVK